MDATERHNRIARDVICTIAKPVIAAGGNTSEILTILESVAAGVLTFCATVDGFDVLQRDSLLMALEDGVRSRLEGMAIPKRESG